MGVSGIAFFHIKAASDLASGKKIDFPSAVVLYSVRACAGRWIVKLSWISDFPKINLSPLFIIYHQLLFLKVEVHYTTSKFKFYQSSLK